MGCKTNSESQSKAKRKWQKLSNLFKGINLLKKNVVKTLRYPNEIVENINNSPRRKGRVLQTASVISSFNATKIALDDVRQQDRFFDLVQRGGERDIPVLLKEIEQDPKRHFYDRSSPHHLINKKNRMNQTPLYLACRNGNLSVVKFLLSQQADPHILSEVDEEEKETPLQVAIRWNHKQVLHYLLESVKWSEREIRAAIMMDDLEAEVQQLLLGYSKARFNCMFNFCLCIS